ncbi:nickel pincer cofactor biosynthesis protein LarB [Archaeoglobus neptunius]|uniref:nickel pincer cofactor biosynthesis protein LarB n=1 Tax=Archaeoglobus neptunius TaxID=2798580 RepID=UPI001926C1FC|nr:nickel pincer cofactor biosynthesis protein LarB [Archaeoglobus neptunius]
MRKTDSFEELVKLDLERYERAGKPEAVYAEGKSVEDILAIAHKVISEGKSTLITRLTRDQMEALKFLDKVEVNERGRIAVVGEKRQEKIGKVAVLCAGTSDTPVAEEAVVTAEYLGLEAIKFYDVGVAGLHRIIEPIRRIREENVDSVIVIAGMEGALPSVIAGIVDVPVIAVPTSVGYGVNLGGISTLFAMLQSCSSGVAVVNIDNGFGAAVFASLISRVKMKTSGKH